MKILTIVRHAKSSWGDQNLSDKERPLNNRGERDAPIMSRRIIEHGIRPSLIIASPAVRAWTTATIIAAETGYPKEFLQRENNLYLATLDSLLSTILAQDAGFNSMLLVAHNPGLTELANFLSPGVTNSLPTTGVVAVEFDQDDWNLLTQPTTRLIAYDYPKLNRN